MKKKWYWVTLCLTRYGETEILRWQSFATDEEASFSIPLEDEAVKAKLLAGYRITSKNADLLSVECCPYNSDDDTLISADWISFNFTAIDTERFEGLIRFMRQSLYINECIEGMKRLRKNSFKNDPTTPNEKT